MTKSISVNGISVFSYDENGKLTNIQFLPDDEFSPILEQGIVSCGQLQVLRNAGFDYVSNKPRARAKSLLLRKAAHGRLSSTRDMAFQLTLKSFSSEDIDWQKSFVTETIDMIADLMGSERMRKILKEILSKL